MKKNIFAGLLALVFCVMLTIPAYAADHPARLVDHADLLTGGEEAELLGTLDEISERQQVDIVVVTENSLGGASPMEYADDFFDNNGYGIGEERDGILLLIGVEEREWHVSTSGYGITAVTDAGLDFMSENFVGYLSDGEYAAAFSSYAGLCDELIAQARAGNPYGAGSPLEEAKKPFGALDVMIAFVIAFAVSLIVTWRMKGKLKSVRSQSAADNYIRNGSLQITKSSDLFLYCHINRVAKPKDTTHRSSSGRRHGGGGGRF